MQAAAKRLRRADDGRAWLAWHVEALARTKKLPKLAELMSRRTDRRRRGPEELLSVARSWAAMHSGR